MSIESMLASVQYHADHFLGDINNTQEVVAVLEIPLLHHQSSFGFKACGTNNCTKTACSGFPIALWGVYFTTLVLLSPQV